MTEAPVALKTVLINLPALVVHEHWIGSMSSADNPWPSLLAFVNCDFTVSNLAVRIAAEESLTGLGPCYTAPSDAITVVGERANARFDRVLDEGMQCRLSGLARPAGWH